MSYLSLNKDVSVEWTRNNTPPCPSGQLLFNLSSLVLGHLLCQLVIVDVNSNLICVIEVKDGGICLILIETGWILDWNFLNKLALVRLNMSWVVAWQLRVVWIEKHHSGRNWWHWVSQSSKLSLSVSKTAISLKFTVTMILEVFADLSFVVTVKSANNFWSWEISGHRIVQITLFTKSMGKWTHFTKWTRTSLLKMSA